MVELPVLGLVDSDCESHARGADGIEPQRLIRVTIQVETRGDRHVPLDFATVYGIAVLGAMVAIAAGLTWIGMQTDPPAAVADADAEAAD